MGSLRSQLKPRRRPKENMLELLEWKVLKAATKTQIYSAEVKDQGRVLARLHRRALRGQTHQWVVVPELI